MTITTNPTFDSYNDLNVTPVYFVSMACTGTHFSSRPLTGKSNYLKMADSFSQDVEPEEGRSSMGDLSFGLIDNNNGDITYMLRESNAVRDDTVQVYMGFEGMVAADFINIFTGKIAAVTRKGMEPGYTIELVDKSRQMHSKLYRTATASNATVLTGNPIDIMLERMMTSKTAGLNHAVYDVGDGHGLSIPSSDIATTDFINIRDNFYPSDVYAFRITEPIDNTKEWFETEFNKPLACYLRLNGDGKIGYVCANPPVLADTIPTLNETSMDVKNFDLNYDMVFTEILFHTDYKATGDKYFQRHTFFEDVHNKSRFGKNKVLTFECKGIHSTGSKEGNYNGGLLINRIKERLFDRYSTPKPVIKAEVTMNKIAIDVGDIVDISHSRLPDVSKGQIGFTGHYYEVINKQISFRDGKITLELLGTNYGQRDKYGLISPYSTVSIVHSASAITLHDAEGFETGFNIGVVTGDDWSQYGQAVITARAGNKLTLDSSIEGMTAGDEVEFGLYENWDTKQIRSFAAISGLAVTYHVQTSSTVAYVALSPTTTYTAYDKVRIQNTSDNAAYADRSLSYLSGASSQFGVLDSVLSTAPTAGKELTKHTLHDTATTLFTTMPYSIW